MNAKKITLIGTLSAMGAVLRVPFAVIPSLQPTTFIIAISGYIFGVRAGVLVGFLSAFISNMFLGQGLWTFMQMFAWGLVGVCFGIMGKFSKGEFNNRDKWLFTWVLFFWGYLFGWIMNIWHWLVTSAEFNLGTFIGVNLSSFFPFDTTHAVGNLFFALFFASDFIKILTRYKKKISYERVTP